jgi:hypothetical protein
MNRGTYGYRKKRKMQRLAIVIGLLAVILVQVLIRQFTQSSSLKVVMTLTAILTVLPMANIASPLLASWKYHSMDRALYDLIRPYEAKTTILYDLILTTKEQIIPLDAVIVHPSCVVGYCPNAKLDATKAEKGLNDLLKASRLDPNLKIIKEEKMFLRRLEGLKPADTYEDDGVVEYTVQTLKSLTM